MDERQDFATAISQQRKCMEEAAKLASAALETHPITPWAVWDTIAVVGMGSSSNAGAVFCEALRAVGVRAVNVDAAAVANYPAGFCPAERVIVISESGRSPEPIAALRRMGTNPIVITNDPSSPVAKLSDFVVPLGGFKDSGVYTIGYTTTLVALAAIAAAHGVTIADPSTLGRVADDVLSEFAMVAGGIAVVLDKAYFLDIVGQGTGQGSAQAAALLFREACALPTAAHQTIQYLHGPMESCSNLGAVMLFGDGRERGIAEQLRQAHVPVVHFAATPGLDDGDTFRLSHPATGYATAIAEVVFAQAIAAQLAGLRHRDVGRFHFTQPDTKLPVKRTI